jgi:hypothetical protein
LRNRQALPIGFDKVTIGKKDRQMLFDDYGVDAADYEDKCGQVEGSYYEDEEAAEASVIDEE